MATFSFGTFFRKLFHHHRDAIVKTADEHTFHLEPKYWQEVITLRERLEKVVKNHTIDDNNIHSVNQRVLDYFFDQINVKGSLPSVKERYAALNTLADRILLNYQTKIVGLKKSESTHTDFSDAVTDFKTSLKEREQKEQSEAALPRP